MNTKSNGRIMLLTICVLVMIACFSMSYNLSGNTMNPIVEQFDLRGASQGLMLSLFNLGSMVPLLALPFLQGRISKIRLIVLFCGIQVAMLLFMGVSKSFSLLLVVSTILGASSGSIDSCSNSYIVDIHPRDNSKYLGLLHGFFGIGGLAVPLIAAPIIAQSGWRMSYYLIAAILIVPSAVLAIVGLKDEKKQGSVESKATEQRLTRAMLREYIRGKRNLLLMGVAITCAVSQMGLTGWVVRYTSVRFHDEAVGSICLTVYWICCTVSRMVYPRLSIKPKILLVYGTLGAGVFHAAGILSASSIGMIIASGLIGLISGPCIPIFISEACRGNDDKTALVSSCLFLLMGLSRMLAPLLMGAVAVSSMVIAMLIPALVALIGAYLAYRASRMDV